VLRFESSQDVGIASGDAGVVWCWIFFFLGWSRLLGRFGAGGCLVFSLGGVGVLLALG